MRGNAVHIMKQKQGMDIGKNEQLWTMFQSITFACYAKI